MLSKTNCVSNCGAQSAVCLASYPGSLGCPAPREPGYEAILFATAHRSAETSEEIPVAAGVYFARGHYKKVV